MALLLRWIDYSDERGRRNQPTWRRHEAKSRWRQLITNSVVGPRINTSRETGLACRRWQRPRVYRVAQSNYSTLHTPYLHQILSDFQTYFHCLNQENICNNTITKDPTTPQVCRYTTLWNISVLKATIENETTYVTTRFKSASSMKQQGGHIEHWCKNCKMRQLHCL